MSERNIDKLIDELVAARSKSGPEHGGDDPTMKAIDAAMEATRTQMLDNLQYWMSRVLDAETTSASRERSECYGMHGSAFKRFALIDEARAQHDTAKRAYERARSYYERAMQEGGLVPEKFHWTATQYLSLTAVLGVGLAIPVAAAAEAVERVEHPVIKPMPGSRVLGKPRLRNYEEMAVRTEDGVKNTVTTKSIRENLLIFS